MVAGYAGCDGDIFVPMDSFATRREAIIRDRCCIEVTLGTPPRGLFPRGLEKSVF